MIVPLDEGQEQEEDTYEAEWEDEDKHEVRCKVARQLLEDHLCGHCRHALWVGTKPTLVCLHVACPE